MEINGWDVLIITGVIKQEHALDQLSVPEHAILTLAGVKDLKYNYACGRNNGDYIQNGDLVMIYFPGHSPTMFSNDKKYVSMEGSTEGDDATMSTCPGINAPSPFVSHFVLTVFSTFTEGYNY